MNQKHSSLSKMSAATEQMGAPGAVKNRKWNAVNVISIVVGMVVYWPVGLFLLGWVICDRQVRDLPGAISERARKLAGWTRQHTGTGNRVFDEYQQTQFDRIAELKAEIREREAAFRRYTDEKNRAEEKNQFDEFMRRGPAGSSEGAGA